MVAAGIKFWFSIVEEVPFDFFVLVGPVVLLCKLILAPLVGLKKRVRNSYWRRCGSSQTELVLNIKRQAYTIIN